MSNALYTLDAQPLKKVIDTLIHVSPAHLILVKSILKENLSADARVWVFGSRARGNAKPFSDLDLAIDVQQPLTLSVMAKMNDAFEESLLPYKVDLVDWQSIDDNFKASIEKDLVVLL